MSYQVSKDNVPTRACIPGNTCNRLRSFTQPHGYFPSLPVSSTLCTIGRMS